MAETRKTVTLTLTATFEGDYIGADVVETYLTQWIDSGLEDRDDLWAWDTKLVSLVETEITEDD